MKKYCLGLAVAGVLAGVGPAAGRAQGVSAESAKAAIAAGVAGTAGVGEKGDSATFYLHKFAQNIGKETFYRTMSDSGVSYAVHFRFVDRGQPVPLEARLVVTPDYEPISLWLKGKTCRFCTISDSVVIAGSTAAIRVDDSSFSRTVKGPTFPVGGYSPGTVQMALLQYWRKHGRPTHLSLLPTGSVTIRQAGNDTLSQYGQRLLLERFVISGLIWGNELVWTDPQGNLICLITNDAEGDKLEMMLDRYEFFLPYLIGRAASYGMELFADEMKGEDKHANAGALGQPGTLAIVGGNMIDVATGQTTTNATILIHNGRITKAGPSAGIPVPAGAKVIHAEGKIILPGLWDMHAHFEQAEWGPAYLAAGVTTVRDCGNEFNYINSVKTAIDDGTGIGPHILKAGIIDGPGPMGLGVIRASTQQEAIAAVR
ncbi:MAG TPA: hypothetical protein VKU83_10290 [Puia sp.]|nr:hypothetical protein [Puia sp.]